MKKIYFHSKTKNAENPIQGKTTKETDIDETKVVGDNQSSSLKLKDLQAAEAEKIDRRDMRKKSKQILLLITVISIVAGTATGVGAYKLRSKSRSGSGSVEIEQRVAGDTIKNGDVYGVKDESIFGDDKAEGYLESGGIEDEGSHRLLRPGGESQTVYLTSSTTDLDKFVGMNVKVAGETFKAQKAGWLMDVGRVEVLNVDGEAPVEE
ncbi:MAG: hypothetical protein PVJ09_02345 [Candidatus Woesebacteria bacterium]